VIRQHHERHDGRRYPDGLAGEEISLAARPGPAAPRGRARGHFDPRCLDAFLALMAERGHRAGGRVDQAAPADASCH
jgi:HD-GYP domain-containing protein (c-di-GMP phosphodiesterase class II)